MVPLKLHLQVSSDFLTRLSRIKLVLLTHSLHLCQKNGLATGCLLRRLSYAVWSEYNLSKFSA